MVFLGEKCPFLGGWKPSLGFFNPSHDKLILQIGYKYILSNVDEPV